MLLRVLAHSATTQAAPPPPVQQTCWLMEGLWRGAAEWLIELRTSSAMFWWNGREDKRLCRSAADMPVKCCGEGGQEGVLMKGLRWWMILCSSLSGLSPFGSCSIFLHLKKKKKTTPVGSRHHLLFTTADIIWLCQAANPKSIVWLVIKFNSTFPLTLTLCFSNFHILPFTCSPESCTIKKEMQNGDGEGWGKGGNLHRWSAIITQRVTAELCSRGKSFQCVCLIENQFS